MIQYAIDTYQDLKENMQERNLYFEKIIGAFVTAEVKRIESIRAEQGDEAWAENLGSSIVTQLTLIIMQDGTLPEQGRRTLVALTPQLMLLYSHPTLCTGAAAGMIEELASRRFIPIDVKELVEYRRQNQDQ
jgi:hypothetical protein